MIGDRPILTNRARCLDCNDVIESKHRHNFVSCRCGNLSVDGGRVYLKRSAKHMDRFEELSTFAEVIDST